MKRVLDPRRGYLGESRPSRSLKTLFTLLARGMGRRREGLGVGLERRRLEGRMEMESREKIIRHNQNYNYVLIRSIMEKQKQTN